MPNCLNDRDKIFAEKTVWMWVHDHHRRGVLYRKRWLFWKAFLASTKGQRPAVNPSTAAHPKPSESA